MFLDVLADQKMSEIIVALVHLKIAHLFDSAGVVEKFGRIAFRLGFERVCYTRMRDSVAALSIERVALFV